MKSLTLILALLGPHTHPTAPEVAEAIDTVCAGDRDCTLDAVATCWMETRCRMHVCREGGTDCGPFQQLARYADHPELVTLSTADRMHVLNTNALIAAEQWLRKRARYTATHGARWPERYNGGPHKARYLERWRRVRTRAEEGKK